MKELKTVVVAEDNLQIGCMRSCLDYLDADISTPWLAGTTGHAFIISIAKGLCPSTPEQSLAEYYRSGRMTELCRNAGFVLEHRFADSDDPVAAAKRSAAFAECRKAMRQGFPCYAYHNFHYQMLARHDQTGFYTVKGQGPVDREGGFEVCIVRPCEPADDRAALKAALQFALEYADFGRTGEKKHGTDAGQAHGSAAYDRWIAHVEKGEPGAMWRAAPAWYGCRALAVQFFDEAQQRIGDAELAPLLKAARDAYAEVASHLKPIARRFTPATGKRHKQWLQDDATRNDVLTDLRAAKAADEKALGILAQIVRRL
jgi:hypothetical protein